MSALRIAWGELRRITAGRLPKLAVVALAIIPMLYAGLYLYANHDPYAGMKRVPAAVVDADTGTTLSTGEKLRVGPQIVSDLLGSHSFDWHEVSAARASTGVANGTYAFALEVPADFSADLASTADFDPRRAHLRLITNDANNYLSHTVANQLVAEVTKSVSTRVSQTAASKLLGGYSRIHRSVKKASTGAAKLADGMGTLDTGSGKLARAADKLVRGQRKLVHGTDDLHDGAADLADGANRLRDGAASLDTGLGTLATKVAPLPGQTRQLADGARQVADGNRQVADTGRQVADATQKVVDDLNDFDDRLRARLKAAGLTKEQIDSIMAMTARLRQPIEDGNAKVQNVSDRLDQLAAGADQVADGNEQLADAMPALVSGVDAAKAGADQLKSGTDELAGGASKLENGAATLAGGQRDALAGAKSLAAAAHRLHGGVHDAHQAANQLHHGLASGLTDIPDPSASTRKAMAATLGAPLAIDATSLSSAGDYGGGLAPFFLSLSAWIGGYVLFLLVRALSNRALATSQAPLRVALGGWIPPALLGIVQMLIAFAVVVLILGIHAERPFAALGLMLLTSISFIAIVHALVAWFGSVGKFLGLVFMVVQLVSAGGTFPWQTLPGPLRALHQVLPMSYAVDGLRQALYGGPNGTLARDALVLLGFGVAALLLTTLAAYRQRVWSVRRLAPELEL